MGDWNPFDLIVLVALVLSTFWGGMRGVVSQLAAILSWVVSWQLASRYYGIVDRFVTISEPWRQPVASLIVFLLSAIAINVAARFLKKTISLSGLKEFDRQMGALFGLLKGALICVVLAFFATIISQKTLDVLAAAKSGRFFVSVASVVVSKTCPNSEVGRKFLSTAEATFGSETSESDATLDSTSGETAQTLKTEIGKLKSYLTKNVFSSTAAEIVEEADAAEKNGVATAAASNEKKNNSIWNWFRADVLSEKNGASTDAGTTDAGMGSGSAPSDGTPKAAGWNDFWSGAASSRSGGTARSEGAAGTSATSSTESVSSGKTDALDNFATFFQSTFGGSSNETATAATNENASNVAKTTNRTAPAAASNPLRPANGSHFLNEFIGVSSTAEKYAAENAAARSSGTGGETGIVGSSPLSGSATDGAFAPVELGASDGSIIGREPLGSKRLQIVPPMPY